MYDQESAIKDIFTCFDRINEQLPPEERIAKDTGTLLVGTGSALESLTLINLMVEIEETVSASSGRRISLLEGALMHKEGARFSTVQQLANWIAERT
ncbi:MAG: hypothetical protein M3Y08_13995 [Fibrobacterota bacterium]|nr:hypothetical protein [Fibrobacterota bacterium]